MSTAIHRRVAACRAGADPTVIARLPSGWAVLGDPQVLAGYCLLLPDPVVPHLNALGPRHREQFMADAARLGDAVLAVTGALRINYASFGNLEPALHMHVLPRHADEPAALRTAHPWAYDWSAAPAFDMAMHGPLLGRLQATLRRSGVSGRLHHLDLTVADLALSTRFYDAWLSHVGFARIEDCAEGPLWRGTGFELGLQAARHAAAHDRYAPGLHHLAFAAASVDEVDRLHEVLGQQGIRILDAPARYDHYVPGYYAVFFADPDGIKLEYAYTPIEEIPPAAV